MTRHFGWERGGDAAVAIFAAEPGQYVRVPPLFAARCSARRDSGTAAFQKRADVCTAVLTGFWPHNVVPRVLLAPPFTRPHDTCARVLA